MQNINYTPIDVEKLKGTKPSNINFYLLILVTIAAAIFSVLLFIYIQQKNETLNQISSTEEITQEESVITPEPTVPVAVPTVAETTKFATESGKISTPTPSLKTTVNPTIGVKTSTTEAKTSSSSAF